MDIKVHMFYYFYQRTHNLENKMVIENYKQKTPTRWNFLTKGTPNEIHCMRPKRCSN